MDDPFSWLYSLSLHGMKLGLGNTKDLLRRLGDPQLSMRHIHVGGSDGKGSISSCVASILISSGIRTGLYTSPHIEEFGERITVNGEKMTRSEAEKVMNAVRDSVKAMEADGMFPTFFEAATAAAFLHFRNKGVEYAVIEVGMGGRLDSTNVIIPEVSVIGNISMEHEEFLGDTIEKIAFEKAGIIKPGVPCVTLNKDPAFGVLKKTAEERGAPIIRIDPEEIVIEAMSGTSTTFLYKRERYEVSIPGSRQAGNASMAIEAVSKLETYGQCIRCNIRKGLRDIRWPCRLEKIPGLPVIMDVTHTAAGSAALAEDVSALYGRVDIVIGMLKDKDARSAAENLSKVSGRVFISGLGSERSADPEALREIFSRRFPETVVCESVSEAMDRAMRSREDGRNILVTGSFHTAEEAAAWLKRTFPGYWTYSQRSMTGEHIPEGRRKV
ncbi:MAG: bifunctional folylpolyglutamate synthase/dihydrofolate synthase [Candidatus Methanoplasma sp.]|jgi:dihydrofolate synthase/folylpolyglutamate synthase|nr:bifunctional folylpolyglutamate synthase/dihydrofolate synthase [Candidatus Methanoplasma sp.]